MAIGESKKKISEFSLLLLLRRYYSIPSFSPKILEQSIKFAIETKTYHQIPNFLNSNANPNPNPNPFSFLSSFPQSLRTQIIDEILQSFIPLRPRSRLKTSYDCLLSHTFQNPNPLPLALAILQRTLRSGCSPAPQIHLSLSAAWLHHRRRDSVTGVLSGMRSIGYRPDRGTCNYLIQSLCAVDELDESGRVLSEMVRVGCDPDLDTYGLVVAGMCRARRTGEAARLLREMVGRGVGLMPREGTVARLMAAMRANGEVERAVETVEALEREMGIPVGFEGYKELVDGCLERKEFVLAAKVVVMMVDKGFVPYIRARQRVVEGLVSVGEVELACIVREKLTELRS